MTGASEEGVFVFGAGYSAVAFLEAPEPARILGATTRSAEKAVSFRARGWPGLVFDGETPGEGIAEALRHTTHLVVSIAPGERGDPVLRCYRETILRAMPHLVWIGYLSTVGVYGDHGGAWVDEATPPRPVSRRSHERLEAEEAWTALAAQRGVPLAILRLSGIYGPGRNSFVNLANGRAKRLVKPGQVFNRIHVADIAGALRLLAARCIGGLYNVTDDEPAPPQDVVLHAARMIGVEPPPEQDFATAELTSMARSFYGENKKVSNRRLKALGYEFFFPTFREGLIALKPRDAGENEG
ncbi:SDR family oxidoreductase [Aureimonas jatrophae]|uniref:Nucleoside-diphosphate-sugar epimerase n=1 Tax=Aureimonas jatrophae TaxID=1166073 RepID=A0A1H0ITA0_9HYPH|nr:SDR family oxidoreductase [Aureimonas jatrophae]MBB3952345.1 hypothetical protein [Aureimonas jatrophae]SDO34553.1 Nucleoside-diphosphate-sugar epimerase [Aureimonas jatrophae]